MPTSPAGALLLRAHDATGALDAGAIRRAARLLRDGATVAFPTETVYGLGADARNAAAVQRVFAAKGRPADNPLIVHTGDARRLVGVAASLPPLARELAVRWWPGPLTLVLDADPALPTATTGGLGTVAVRVPDHPVALALLRDAGIPVAAPSANRSGRPSPTSAAHVLRDLAGAVDAVLDGGACGVGVESTVVDVRGRVPIVLREGAVTREDLGLDAGGCAGARGAGRVREPGEELLAASPGTRYRHYAPACTVRIAPAGQGPALAAGIAAGGSRVGLVARGAGPPGVHTIGRFTGADELARALYAWLRDAEDADVDVLVVEEVAEQGLGRAVMDRLRRAAAE